MVAAAGLPFAAVSSAGLRRSLDWRNLLIPWRAAQGTSAQGTEPAGRPKPAAVLMTGGYVGAPLSLAAALRERVPLVLLEPNASLGLANRFFSGAAEALCLAYPMPGAAKRSVVTGTPCRFSQRLPRQGRRPGKTWAWSPAKRTLLVLTGSQAAHSVNEALRDGLKPWPQGPASGNGSG